MKRKFRKLTASLCLLVSAAAVASCSSGEPDGRAPSEAESTGTIVLNLALPDGSELNTVQWKLLKSGSLVKSGSAPVQKDGAASSVISGVAVGSGYSVEMVGVRTKGKGTCEGQSATFKVVAKQTAQVAVTMQCGTKPGATGGVAVAGELNFCPTPPSIAASASSGEIGSSPISLNGLSSDPDGDAVTYAWSAASGSFSNPSSPASTFTCAQEGTVALTLTANDGKGCKQDSSIEVQCTPDCDSMPTSDYRTPCNTASDQILLASGLNASYATRAVANNTDQFVFWPHASTEPTHLVFCIESSREELADGRLQPSVQVMDLETKEVRTVVRGMVGCDGIRTTPWGTVLATEEFADDNGGLYELMLDPNSNEEYSVTERGTNGAPASIVDSSGNDASNVVTKRTATASMAWEGLLVLPSGVIVGGDEERPGSTGADADGGAIFKFVPSVLRTNSAPISALGESPLVAGSLWALQASCVNNGQQFGQGCEIGNAGWVSVNAATARPDANRNGATGFYRPEDLELDPHYSGPGVRFCFANTGNASAANFGEVICAIDSAPDAASSARTVELNRLIEGDGELNAPDNIAFHPTIPGLIYVIEDNNFGDVWACLPDGADRDLKSDGCVRMLSLRDRTAEPTGFIFAPDGLTAYLSVQHSRDRNMPFVDGYATDDLILLSGFGIPDLGSVNAFGSLTEARLAGSAETLVGFDGPLHQSASVQVSRASSFSGGVAPTAESNGFGEDASATMSLADGLSATYLTRVVANSADQFEFWPHASANPDYLVFCIEGSRELVAADKYNPSVQAVDIATGAVRTIVRGMVGCDGLRVSPWGTLLATEEFADDNGALYEILWDPSSSQEFTITERGANGVPATIVDSSGADATDRIIKRTAMPSMAWEGLIALESGVVIGGDEERPGSVAADSDGGAIFKFVPTTLRTANTAITSLGESPLVAGSNYAMQVSCVNNAQQFGQGCEIGNAAWVPVSAAKARPDADAVGATGYYRPEDLQLDPSYTGEGIRFCVANTGNAGAKNYGEVLCAIDKQPNVASATVRSVVINRFVEGDTQLNAPDNLEFQPGSGVVYVIEDNAFGDVWACLPDGSDRDIKTDGCVRALSLADRSAEPTGFKFHPDGTKAYLVVQHSQDPAGSKVDDYDTDDLVVVHGFAPVQPATGFGAKVATRLATLAPALFGFGTPLTASVTQ